MLSFTRRVALLAAAMLVAACDTQSAAPTAPVASKIPSSASGNVERFLEEWVSDMSGVSTKFFCADGTETELVALEGKIFTRDATTVVPSGAIIFTSHSMPVGLRGVGTVSGHEYRVKEQRHYAVSQREPGYAGTSRTVFDLTNQVTMKTYKLVQVSHYTVDANGEVVVEREKIREECGS